MVCHDDVMLLIDYSWSRKGKGVNNTKNTQRICVYLIVLRGIPLQQPLDDFASRAPFLLKLQSLKSSDHQKLAGNSQSLPVFGSMFVLALLCVKCAEGPADTLTS